MKINDLSKPKFLTDETKIKNWIKNSFIGVETKDLKIDSDGVFYPWGLQLLSGIDKLKVQFKLVKGRFNVSGTDLVTLIGCPSTVMDVFHVLILK